MVSVFGLQVEHVTARLVLPRGALDLETQSSRVVIREQLDLEELPDSIKKECEVGSLRGSYRVEEYGWHVRRRDGGVISEIQWERGVEAWIHDWDKAMEWWGPKPGDGLDITSNGGQWSVVGSEIFDNVLDNPLYVRIQMGSSIQDSGDIVSYMDGYFDNGRLQEDEWVKRFNDMCRFNREIGDEAVSWDKKVDSISLGEEGLLLWTSVGQIGGYLNIFGQIYSFSYISVHFYI